MTDLTASGGVDATPSFSQAMAAYPSSGGSAWASVMGQLTAEGANVEAINRAKEQFGTQLLGLASNFQADIGQAAKGAAEYVQAGFTIGGAVAHVGGLVAGAASEPPAQLVQTSVGVLLGVMVASGAMTAGVGAAVTGVVAVLSMVLDKAGLFGSPPTGTEICPGVRVNPKPDWVVGCVPFYSPSHDGKPVTAALISTSGDPVPNPLWQRFPRPDLSRDKTWFALGYAFGPASAQAASAWSRKIDVAFPDYAWIEWDEKHPVAKLSDFQKAYASAWRINKERALNGQKESTDAEVLYHTNLAWNAAHDSAGATDYLLKQQNLPNWSPGPTANLTQAIPQHGPYVASLIRSMQSAGLTSNFGPDGQSLRVNMGPRKVPPTKAVVQQHIAMATVAAPPPVVQRTVTLSLAHIANAPVAAVSIPVASSPVPAPRSVTSLFGQTESFLVKMLPYTPAVAGVVLLPFFGWVPTLVGGAASALWVELKKS